MPGQRIQIDLFIPDVAYNAIPSATKLAFQNQIRALKALAAKLNAGANQEEMTVRAVMHHCHNDEVGIKCELEQDI